MKNKPLKVLLLLASPGPDMSGAAKMGGMEKQVALQASYLSRYSDLHIGLAAAPSYHKLVGQAIPFFAASMEKSRRHPLLMWQLVKIVRRFNPDIVHAHGHKAAFLTKILQPLFKHCKFVATAHGTKRNNKAVQHLDQVFAVSKGVQSALSPLPSIILENGVEACQGPQVSKSDVCQSLDLDPALPLVMAAGRLVPVKRYDALIRAFKGLPANLVIWGDGPERNRLRKLLGRNTLLAGYRADVRNTLAAADMLVISSEREGQSLSMIEALQSQVPVISTRVSGAEDLLPESCLIDSVEEPAFRAYLQKQLSRINTLRSEQSALFDYALNSLTCERLAQQLREQYYALCPSN